MDSIFQIGSFPFRLRCPKEVQPPENFMKFICEERAEIWPEYTYEIRVADALPMPEGKVLARRPDLVVFREENGLEARLIGVKGRPDPYACYRELSEERAQTVLLAEEIRELHIDPLFSSLLALERRLIRKDEMVLHCAYVEYKGEAILFSAPSETGKTTQADLWAKHRGSRTVNGDRALLGKTGGRWTAQGWPVCGTSEVCHNESIPIRAVVMLSQAKENRAERMTPGQAFPLLYSQITVNKWNAEDHVHTLDLIDSFLREVPVYHLGCTISEEAVECLAETLGVAF